MSSNEKSKAVCRGWAFAWLAAAVFVMDRVSKLWAMSTLQGAPRDVWPGVLRFAYVENRGAAFGVMQGNAVLLTVLTGLILAGLLALLAVRGGMYPSVVRAALWTLWGGGVGNLYDRIVYGYVVDFIEPLFVRFAVFNLADACMVIAVIVLVGWIAFGGSFDGG